MSFLVAHRGFPASYPENTLVGIQAAVNAGARFVEVDVQLSADRHPVLYHDRTLQRVSQQAGAIHQFSLEEIQNFRAFEFERFGYRYAQTPITRLTELAEYLAARPDVIAFIELKRVAIEQFGAKLVAAQASSVLAAVQKQCTIISYSLEVLAAVRELGWSQIAAVTDDWGEHRRPEIRRLKPQILFCDYHSLPRWGRPVYPYGKLGVFQTTDPDEARRLFRRGIDFVETDDIAAMLEALNETNWTGSGY